MNLEENTQDEFVQEMIINAIRTLAFIPMEQLKRMVDQSVESINQHEAFAPILDPGSYFNGQRTGKTQDAKYQAEIVQKVYELMKVVHAREDFVKSRR